jgi:alpha-tubulin suppressor-like RCC1 family protein
MMSLAGDGVTPYTATVYAKFTIVTIFKNLLFTGERITKIVSGGAGTGGGGNALYFKTSTGRLFGMGNDYEGAMGIGTAGSQNDFIPGGEAVVINIPGKQISAIGNYIATDGCSYDTTISVTPGNCAVPNAIYGFGDNSKFQIDNSAVNRTTPTALSGLASNIVTVAAGTQYAVALTTDGLLYSWGVNNYGMSTE